MIASSPKAQKNRPSLSSQKISIKPTLTGIIVTASFQKEILNRSLIIFRDDFSSQLISIPLLQHPMELADDVCGAKSCIMRSKVMIWSPTIRKTSRRFKRSACSVSQKIIIAIFATSTL